MPWATFIWQRVKKLMPGLNAAFVNVGYERMRSFTTWIWAPNFAMYSSVVEQVLDDKKKMPHIDKMTRLPEIDKARIGDRCACARHRQLLVQIVKSLSRQRSATDHGDLVCRPQHGADAVWRKGVGVAENRFRQQKRRACANWSRASSLRKLQGDSAHIGRGQRKCRS